MSIQRPRLVFHDNFTIMSNNWARDGRLSLRARGLLVQLLSHRPGWEVSTASLVRDNPEGRDAIRKAIRELEKFGYLKRTQLRDGTEFSGMEYVLQEPPQEGCGFPVDGFPVDGNPDVGESTPKEDYPSEDHLQEEPTKLSASRRKPSRPIPEDWYPLDRHREKARAKNLSVDLQAEAFTNHALANDRRCVNWDRAFDNWILKATPGRTDYNPLDRSSYG